MEALTLKIPNRWIIAGCIAFAFILYGNTLLNKYCLDDSMVITQNKFTQKGFAGIPAIFTTESFTGFFGEQKNLVAGARYRPLSIATFAVEYAFFGENPGMSHFINILLYALTVFLLFLIVQEVFGNSMANSNLLAWICALLFIIHPIHTEVIANIKGRDEILALLLSLWASWCMLLYIEKRNFLFLALASFIWFLALLSKENAFVFLILMPVLLFLPAQSKWKSLIKPIIGFLIAAILFLFIRHTVIGNISSPAFNELMNNSYIEASGNQKYATIFWVLLKYLMLLFFPYPLTYDYYPYHISLVSWGSVIPVLSLLLYCFLIGYAIRSMRKNFIVFVSIMFYLIPLIPVSNILFPIGTFMNERFLFFSSIGFCILIAYIFMLLFQKKAYRNVSFLLLLLVCLLSGYKTVTRNKVWYNDYTLFTTDVKTSANSAKGNCTAGGILIDNCDSISDPARKIAVVRQSIGYLKKAVSIHPQYADAWLLLGNAYFKEGDKFDSSIICYSTILKTFPQHKLALGNLYIVAEKTADIDKKFAAYKTYLQYDTSNFLVYYKMGQIYGRYKNDLVKSVAYLSKSLLLNPNAKEVYIDLGVAYGLQKNYVKSAEMLEKAVSLDPINSNIYINLGLTYNFLGNTQKARACFAKADSLKMKK